VTNLGENSSRIVGTIAATTRTTRTTREENARASIY
jgi:hypothetical protein